MRDVRHTQILDIVNSRQVVTVKELVDELKISTATVRRDLEALSQAGLLQRTRGGAQSLPTYLPPVIKMDQTHSTQKAAIAQHCLEYIKPGAMIGVTGGSTVGALAHALAQWAHRHKDQPSSPHKPLLTIVTNAVDIAYRLAEVSEIKIVLTGGVINGFSYELTGPYAIDVLNQISLDMAFIGVNGFDENGPGTVDEYEASVNHTMITRAQQTFIVADSSKFGKRSFTSISGDSDRLATTIITDSSISQEWADRVTQQGYNLRIV
ncbi:DeoR/GlpR family DNA-binding transcription regulator [Rothia sp. CCM 9417]|uniref:DeoR/GlpR family DNA-binding transcription regulator n=1 Tax=unclassified Rothia (in: high G+C Gram-positive bacteria) TaxID=2689056 RepID=UPI003AE34430